MPPQPRSPRLRAEPFVVLLSILALAAACDCNDSPPVCESADAPPSCGVACTDDSSCGAGTYCGPDDTCTADCTPGGGQCGSGRMCDPDGRCIDDSDAGTGGGAGGGGACNPLDVTADPVQPHIIFIIDRSGSMTAAYPYESGLSCSGPTPSPPCLSRWNSLRAIFLGADDSAPEPLRGPGVITQFQSLAHIGVVQYTGASNKTGDPVVDPPVGVWPILISTPAETHSADAIALDYLPQGGGNPPSGGETPTGESIWMTLCHLEPPYDSGLGCTSYRDETAVPMDDWVPAPSAPLLPADRNPNEPIILVLATDGEPDSSLHANPDPSAGLSFDSFFGREARRFVRDAIREARLAGIPTYVISVDDGDDTLNMNRHLGQMACEGGTGPTVAWPGADGDEPLCTFAGDATYEPPPGAPGMILANDASTFRDALNDIIVSSIPCSFQLDGTVNDVAAARSAGMVSIDGASVPLDQVNGWYLLDDGRTFTLNGEACDTFRENPGSSLAASFPCGSGVIITPD